MKNLAQYEHFRCPYDHIAKECGHELHGPEGYENTQCVWCACGFRGPVFCLDPEELRLELKAESRKNHVFGSQSVGGELAASMGVDPRPFLTRREIRRQLELTGMSEIEWNAAMDRKLATANNAPF